jgi:hypothetical protein
VERVTRPDQQRALHQEGNSYEEVDDLGHSHVSSVLHRVDRLQADDVHFANSLAAAGRLDQGQFQVF